MKTLNLKKYYYPICKKDTFVEVPDEVADAIVEESRAENANDAKQHYHCYSLDASPGIERHFPEQVISPEDILMEKETEREQEAARALMMERLQEALATLTPRQASCLHARFWEGSSGPQDGESDHTGIVERVEDGIVYTVEGNSGDSCRENHYAVGYYEILGYGIPAY